MSQVTYSFYSFRFVYLIHTPKNILQMDIKQNLTNVRLYDCTVLSLCQVHCCKYGEQIKKRPCCHSIEHFYIVFSTKRKIVHKSVLQFCSYSYTQNQFCPLQWRLQVTKIVKLFLFNYNEDTKITVKLKPVNVMPFKELKVKI